MKKLTPKRNGHSRQVGGGLSALHREIKGMSARGLVEDQIGLRVGLDKNQLRARYIDAVKEGRVIAAKRREARAAAVALTPEEYHFLDAATPSFTSHWFDTVTTLSKRNGGVFPFVRVYETIDGRNEVQAHGTTRDMPIWGREFTAQSQELNPYYNPEAFARAKILALTEYVYRLQEK